ncbi:MAG: T9SS type A sorting domain-containing protein [Bacteroidales bacterium]|nr:T9SS type A sorting domain-containing protein [Bacteroidales bacterium]
MSRLFLILFLVVCFAFSGNVYGWSNPAALTNSLTDNTQAIIRKVTFIEGESFYMFWIKSTGPESSGIYAKDVYGAVDETPVIEISDHIYRNPWLINLQDYWWTSDYYFILFYESNQTGNFDIYYILYGPEGLSDPQILADSPDNENHFRSSNYGKMVWEANGQILFAEMDGEINFTEPEIFADFDCSEPEILVSEAWGSEQYVAWKQTIFDGELVYFSKWDSFSGTWSEPEEIANAYEISSLKFGNNIFVPVVPFLFWDNIDINGNSVIRGYDFESEDYFEPDFTRYGNFNPAAFISFIPLKFYYDQTFLAFENIVDGHSDIFVNPDESLGPDSTNYVNLTDTITEDKNPGFHLGQVVSTYFNDLFLVWEKEINGHVQLFYSKTLVGGTGIEEKKAQVPIDNINIYPIPFSDELNISFSIREKSELNLDLLYNSGRSIENITNNVYSKGDYIIEWNSSNSVAHLQPGIYFIRFEMDQVSWLEKVVLLQKL